MTVSELIAELQKFPSDRPVGIRDADTRWWGPIIHICDGNVAVELSIDYCEMETE